MGDSLVLMNSIFDYLVKVQNSLHSVKVLDCSLNKGSYPNDFCIRIIFTTVSVNPIRICKDCVFIEGTKKEYFYEDIMDLIEILESFRKSIDKNE